MSLINYSWRRKTQSSPVTKFNAPPGEGRHERYWLAKYEITEDALHLHMPNRGTLEHLVENGFLKGKLLDSGAKADKFDEGTLVVTDTPKNTIKQLTDINMTEFGVWTRLKGEHITKQ